MKVRAARYVARQASIGQSSGWTERQTGHALYLCEAHANEIPVRCHDMDGHGLTAYFSCNKLVVGAICQWYGCTAMGYVWSFTTDAPLKKPWDDAQAGSG